MRRKLIYGVGINDLKTPTTRHELINGKYKVVWRCKVYSLWIGLLARSYSEKEKARHPSYQLTRICDDWKFLSNFQSWMQTQINDGLSLDKDILVQGNKEYGPNTCAFVPAYVNTCLVMSNSIRGEFPVGVTLSKVQVAAGRDKIFVSTIKDKRSDGYKQRKIGYFTTAYEAHSAWRKEKVKILEKVISDYAKEDCFRTDVAEALMSRVWKLRLDEALNKETTDL